MDNYLPESAPSRGRRIARSFLTLFVWVCVSVGAIGFGTAFWIHHQFGNMSYDQLILNIPHGDISTNGGYAMVWDAVKLAAAIPLGIVAACAVLYYAAKKRWRLGARFRRIIAAEVVCSLVILAAGGYSLMHASGIDERIRASMSHQNMADYYVEPAITGQHERHNLVMIYLESMEDTFADTDLFEMNMLEPVQAATADGWERIPRLEQFKHGWTVGGLVATQCGLQLRTVDGLLKNIRFSDDDEAPQFLPNATCLPEVLGANGYVNVAMIGGDSTQGEMNPYFVQHGYDEVYDLATWKKNGETEIRPDWGLSDRRLLELAKDELTTLHDAGQPFNLTVMTLDTHDQPYLYDYCDIKTKEPLTGISYCSMELVADYIDFIEEQGYLEDTTVVVIGDHLKYQAPANSYWETLKDLKGRTIFNRWSSPEEFSFARDTVDQYSVYPTVLELVGLEVADHRAGLGLSALVDASSTGSPQGLSSTDYRNLMSSGSDDFYQWLWGRREGPLPVTGRDNE